MRKEGREGVAILLFENDMNHIWLCQRLSEFGKGTYSSPGGLVEPGELPAMAASRELKEETGLTIPAYDLSFSFIGATLHENPAFKTDVTYWYGVMEDESYEISTHIQNTEPDKHGPWTRYTIEEAYKLPLFLNTKDMIETVQHWNKVWNKTHGIVQ